ncbi:ROK family transcriptional regulator [Actinotalea ferrariae]|uniref:ROK family transcriptional regulator n=1 Tax=Actinotalea ferrariae TaxID=1386098 RepID=UPI0027DEC920|nr:ROK family transcriptional regulator [Actinotalea ferrariae]
MSTQAAVIDVIRAAGTISRAGLIEETGLTGATISTLVRGLIDQGLVVETGRAESTGGKPRVLLQLEPTARYAVGVHLDHAGIVYVVTTLAGGVVAQMSRAGVGVDDPPVVVERMAREVAALLASAGVDPARVSGLGLVAPGPLAPHSGMRLTPPSMRQWEDFPLDGALEDAVGVPVLLDNDATAAALGEHWSGRAGARATFATVYMGTGIGAGLIVNGGAYVGVSGNAGEIGHVCLDLEGPECWCGARGCTEAIAGPAAVVAAARADRSVARAAGLDRRSTSALTSTGAQFAAVTRAALRGHDGARALLDRSARYVAVATRTLANVMDLDLVVLTGPGFALAGSVYLPVMQAELDRFFFSRSTHGVEVRLSPVATTAAAIGAAAMALQSELVPQRGTLRLPDRGEQHAATTR